MPEAPGAIDHAAIKAATEPAKAARLAKRTTESIKQTQEKWDANPGHKASMEKKAAEKAAADAEDLKKDAENVKNENKVEPSTQMEETKRLAYAAISKKAEGVFKSGNITTPAENILAGIHVINTGQEGEELHVKPTNPIKFKMGELEMEIIGGKVNKDGKFDCTTQITGDPDSDNKVATFTKEEIVAMIITSDTETSDAIVNALPEDQRSIADLYIDVATYGEAAFTENASKLHTPGEINDLIQKSANSENVKIPTIAVVNGLVAKMEHDGLITSEKAKTIAELTKGKNLLTPDIASEIFQFDSSLDGIIEAYPKYIRTLEKGLENSIARGELDKTELDEEHRKIAIVKEVLTRATNVKEGVTEDGTQKFYERLCAGQLDPKIAGGVTTAITSGDMDQVAKMMLSENGELSIEDSAALTEKQRLEREKLKNAMGMGLIGLLVVFSGLKQVATS